MRYQDLHWGTDPKFVDEIPSRGVLHKAPCRRLTEVVAISYVSEKEGRSEVYRHGFDEVDGRYPYLLEYDPRGKYRSPAAREDLIELGKVIDFEALDGGRIFVSCYSIMSTRSETNSPVLFVSRFGAEIALERRKGKPSVRPEGIIH